MWGGCWGLGFDIVGILTKGEQKAVLYSCAVPLISVTFCRCVGKEGFVAVAASMVRAPLRCIWGPRCV